MSATAVSVNPNCRSCGSLLELDEMHFFAFDDGTATCNNCEGAWMAAVDDWKRGDRADFPARGVKP